MTPDSIDNLIYYEIGRDHGNDDRAYISRHSAIASGQPLAAALQAVHQEIRNGMPSHALGKPKPRPSLPHHAPGSNLSIKLITGNNLYIVRLTDDNDHEDLNSNAKFGPYAPAISVLPSGHPIQAVILSDAQLLWLEGGQVRAMPAQEATTRTYDTMPDKAWLVFRCEYTAVRQFWDDNLAPQRHEQHDQTQAPGQAKTFGQPLQIKDVSNIMVPFHFNIWDKITRSPIWVIEEDHDHDHDHAADKPLLNHGGVHPFIHGGVHPNTLVEYFYEP